MKSRTLIFTLFLFLCVSSFGMAFDNQRGGFIIGGLGGVTLNLWNQTAHNHSSNEIYDETNFGFHTDFRIGGGFKGNKLMLYYWNVLNWFIVEDYMVNVYGDKATIISGITAVGMSYYFKPTSPSLYINVGLGPSLWYAPFDEAEMIPWLGFGFMGGVGYEFATHWSIECGIIWSHLFHNGQDYGYKDMESGGYLALEGNTTAITLSIIGIAY